MRGRRHPEEQAGAAGKTEKCAAENGKWQERRSTHATVRRGLALPIEKTGRRKVFFKHSDSATPFRQNFDDPDESGLLADTRNALSAIAEIVVGAITWSLSFMLLLSSGAGVNRVPMAPVFLFLAPILAVVFPTFLKLLFRNSTSAAIWLFAVAPLIGGLNIALGLVVIDRLGNGDQTSIKAIQCLLIFVWLLPVLVAVKGKRRS